MAVERRLTIPGVLERIPEACDFVVQAAEAAGLDERAVYYCQMAVDEWCTNIIEHGYSGPNERNLIDITCVGQPNLVTITISDSSPAFDPTKLQSTEPSKALEQREPGGLGWFFIRKIMDEVHYEYKNGHNNLTMIKHGIEQPARSGRPTEPVFPSNALNDGIWLIMPTGRLDSVNGPTLEASFARHLEANHFRLIVDMSAVSYISSGGLKVLVSTWRKVQKAGGNLLLAGLTPRVYKVFEISGFDSLFTIVETIGDAAASLNKVSGKS